jgi:hypothetical protein
MTETQTQTRYYLASMEDIIDGIITGRDMNNGEKNTKKCMVKRGNCLTGKFSVDSEN